MKRMNHRLLCLLLIASLAIVTSCVDDAGHQIQDIPEEGHQAHVMAMEPEVGVPITGSSLYQVTSVWTTQNDNEILLGDLKGYFVVMAMTYTRCEFSCPLIVEEMKKIINQIPDHEKQRVRLVLLSIDPEHDTPEVMKAFAERKGLAVDRWTILRGDADDILEMAALIGVRYKKLPDGEFAHANIITLLNTRGEIVHQQNGLGSAQAASSAEVLQVQLSEES